MGTDKGTWAETAVVEYVGYSGFPHADRIPRSGAKDRGDVKLCPGVIAEVKNCKKQDISGWLRETEVERQNANAVIGFLVVKPEGVGRTRIGDWWSVMYADQWEELVLLAQAAPPLPHIQLSGGKYKGKLAELARDRSFGGTVVVCPPGVKNEADWYVLTRLSWQTSLLRAAGYGNAEVLV